MKRIIAPALVVAILAGIGLATESIWPGIIGLCFGAAWLFGALRRR